MAEIVYFLCAVGSIGCAFLLLRNYKRSAARLLLWSGLFFVFFGVSNIILVLDLVVFPEVDLFILRSVITVMGLALLLYGLIWETA